jgi:hypothetical protein
LDRTGYFQSLNAAHPAKDIMSYDLTVIGTGPGSFDGNITGVSTARIA